jgi:4-hydroxy-tetrahydrodipicolinate reductase
MRGMAISVCVAGATGWTGRAVAEAIRDATDLDLHSAVSRTAAGRDLGEVWGGAPLGVPVYSQVAEALAGADVLVDYTSHDVVRTNTLTAIERGVHVVIGSSGLTADDFADIDRAARAAGVGVFAAGNFSLTATLATMAAVLAAKHLPSWEIVDYAEAGKPDAPSGTSRELAERLGEVAQPVAQRPVAETAGPVEARGATVAGAQIHSVRLPGFTLSTEVVFGLPDERLVIRHDSGTSPAPYVGGTLLAVRAVPGLTGLVRGLSALLGDG